MDDRTARELVAAERRRVEASLLQQTADLREQRADTDPTGDEDSGELATELAEEAVIQLLRDRLAAVERAEQRLTDGSYGRSIESGVAIPDDRLRADPLAERTVEEQARYESS